MPITKSKLIIDGREMRGEAMPEILATFRQAVIGRTIKNAGYLSLNGECYPVLLLDNGETILIQQDDECNGPGVALIAGKNIALCQTYAR